MMGKEDDERNGAPEEDGEDARELMKDGLDKLWKATKKVSKGVVEGFKEGYSEEKEES
jgi:hypothetical protein